MCWWREGGVGSGDNKTGTQSGDCELHSVVVEGGVGSSDNKTGTQL